MATLTNTKIKDTYDGLLKTADNDVVGASEKNITDGLGNATVLSIGTASASFSSDVEVNGLTIGLGSGSVVTNTALGSDALFSNTSGSGNVSVGQGSMRSNTTGSTNIAVGKDSLRLNTTGNANVAVGYIALYNNIDGADNVAVGYSSLSANTSGSQNVAIGRQALLSNTTGGSNTAIGYVSLVGNITGINNTAVGRSSLYANTASFNTAFGAYALLDNTTGSQNVAVGHNALVENTIGGNNTAIGVAALGDNVSGSNNVALGYHALRNAISSSNTAVGKEALTFNTTGSGNVAVGYEAGYSKTSGDDSIYIGHSANGASATTSNEIVIGSLATGNGSNTATYGNGSITDHYFTAGNVHIVGDLTVGGTMPSSDLDLTGTPYGEGDILTVSSSGTLTKIDKDSAAEYLGVNSKTLMKDLSFGESYVNNFRSRVIDNTGTYFPTPSGYNFGVMKNKGLVEKMGVMLLPSGVKSGGLFSVKPSNGNGDFDFTRASTATYVDEDGLISVAPTGTPRLDYPLIDGVVQDTPSLLLEPSRTNGFVESEDYSTLWSVNNTVVSSNQSISPDGSQNADLITENNTANPHFIFQTIGTTSLTQYTISVFAKTAGRLLQIFIGGGDVSGNPNANFDLDNGLLNNNGCDDAFMEYYGNGWYRCGVVVTAATTSGFNPCFGLVEYITSSRASTYTGDGTSGVYLWGAMIEAGSYATSYIPTAGSTVTRAAETCNGAGTSADFNDSEGVLFVESKWFAVSTTIYHNISNGTNNERVLIYSTDPENIRAIITSGGSNIYAPNVTANSRDFNKVAFKYSTSDRALWVNGFKLASESGTKTMPTGLNTCGFDAGASGGFDGKNNQFITFKQALTDAELEDLTSWDSFSEMAEAQQYQTV